MNKVWTLIKREYRAAVKTKGFIIGLVLLPIMMGGTFAIILLTEDNVDLKSKTVLVVDESGSVGQFLVNTAKDRNQNFITDKETGEKIQPEYFFTLVDKETDFDAQKLTLSDKVRDREIHAFVHIGPDVIHQGDDPEGSRILYYAENSTMDPIKNWVSGNANSYIRQVRVKALGIDEASVQNLFQRINAEGMGLLSIDSKTGGVKDAKKSSELESVLIPYVMLMLIFMMIMMSAIPLLTAVMEEKSERIAEVLLGSVTPTQFMLGKVLGGLAVALTTASIYVLGAVFTISKLDYGELIPYYILPWFFVYLILAVVLYGTIMAALGSSCNDSKDAQAIQFPAMIPIMIPMFVLLPVIKDPLGDLATWMSLFPPFTPMLMLVRQATPVTIPMWQPIVGLIGVFLFTAMSVWAGGRLFRSCIIMVGKRPKIGTMIKYIIKG
ncbi:MAG: ABC transporter permease [Bacteroidales bacterium]|nr:ABC transporter permease [Bacteroidales bacterium]